MQTGRVNVWRQSTMQRTIKVSQVNSEAKQNTAFLLALIVLNWLNIEFLLEDVLPHYGSIFHAM